MDTKERLSRPESSIKNIWQPKSEGFTSGDRSPRLSDMHMLVESKTDLENNLTVRVGRDGIEDGILSTVFCVSDVRSIDENVQQPRHILA